MRWDMAPESLGAVAGAFAAAVGCCCLAAALAAAAGAVLAVELVLAVTVLFPELVIALITPRTRTTPTTASSTFRRVCFFFTGAAGVGANGAVAPAVGEGWSSQTDCPVCGSVV